MTTKLGEGTFGIVYAMTSPNSKQECAIKRNLVEDKVSFISVLREIDVLYTLHGHPHIVNLWKLQYGSNQTFFSPLTNRTLPRKGQRNDYFHFIFPRANNDLLKLLTETPDYALYKFYMVQLLLGLNYMHINGYIHRDIKPQNILCFDDNNFKSVKICDFGLTKPYTMQGKQTPNTVTSWYRAPEIALGNPHYDQKSDVWSLGCVFYELISRQPFINTQKDNNDQILNKIIQRLPQKMDTRKYRELILKNPWRPITLSPSTRTASPPPLSTRLNLTLMGISQFEKQAGSYQQLCDVLTRMLTFEPELRASCEELLDHEFFDDHRVYINKVLQRWPVLTYSNPAFDIYPGIERNWLAKEITIIFNNRRSYVWYSTRTIFMAIDIIYIYLQQLKVNHNASSRNIESEDRGKLTTRHNLIRTIYCAIYMAIKYYSTLQLPIRYEEVFPRTYHNAEDRQAVESTELNLLIAMNYRIYRPTLYELADTQRVILEDADICRLIYILTQNVNLHEAQPLDVIKLYIQNLRDTEDFDMLKSYTWNS